MQSCKCGHPPVLLTTSAHSYSGFCPTVNILYAFPSCRIGYPYLMAFAAALLATLSVEPKVRSVLVPMLQLLALSAPCRCCGRDL